MHKYLSTLLVVIIFTLSVSAQKRNNLKLIGIGFDNIITTKSILKENSSFSNRNFVLACAFNWGFGFERLVGTKLVLGMNYNKFFTSQTGSTSYSDYFDNGYRSHNVYFQPQLKPNQYFVLGNYKSSGSTFGFETKYYFSPHQHRGANGIYMASSYQLSIVNHGFIEAQYTDTSGIFERNVFYSFDNKTTLLNRFGFKLGASASSILSTDFFIGLYYSPTGSFDQLYLSPITNRNISFVMGWQIGVPF